MKKTRPGASPQGRLEIPGLVELSQDALLATNGGRGRALAREPRTPAAPKPAGFFESLLRPWR